MGNKGAKTKHQYIEIPLIHALHNNRKKTHCIHSYNISTFIESCRQMPKKWHDRLNSLVQTIDEKVWIDPEDPRYKPVYEGIDTITDRLCNELRVSDPMFSGMKRRLTGSV